MPLSSTARGGAARRGSVTHTGLRPHLRERLGEGFSGLRTPSWGTWPTHPALARGPVWSSLCRLPLAGSLARLPGGRGSPGPEQRAQPGMSGRGAPCARCTEMRVQLPWARRAGCFPALPLVAPACPPTLTPPPPDLCSFSVFPLCSLRHQAGRSKASFQQKPRPLCPQGGGQGGVSRLCIRAWPAPCLTAELPGPVN